MVAEKLYLFADKILYFAFCLLLFTVPLIFLPQNYELFEFNKMMLTYALTVVILACWAIKCTISGRLIFRRTPLDIFLLGFLASQFLSFSVSIDQHTSIWGYYTRSNGGLLSTITYIALYWAFVSNFDIRKTQNAIRYLLSSAVIISLWGILEHFGKSPSCLLLTGNFDASCWVQDVQTRVFATLGQPNWMAAWLVAVAPLSWALAISKIKNKTSKMSSTTYQISKLQIKNQKFWISTVISVILFTALLFTKSRSGILGFLTAYILFWTTLAWINRNNLLFLVRPFLIFNFLFFILASALGTPWTPSILEQNVKHLPAQAGDTQNVETGTVLERGGTESGEIRKIVWKGAMDIWRAYPLFGSGVETFAYSYYNFRPVEHNLTSEWNFLYNKAHNEYLNFLATTGVFGLGTYLLLIGAFLWWGLGNIKYQKSKIKNTDKNLKNFDILNCHFDIYILNFALLAGFASILVTNFFGFSVVPVALLFFLYPAMVQALNNADQNAENSGNISANQRLNQHKSAFNPSKVLGTFGILIIGGYLLTQLGQVWYADTLFAQADKLIKSDEPATAVEKLEKAIKLNPAEPNYRDKLATAYSTIAALSAEALAEEDAKKYADLAKQETDKAYTISPKNISLLKSRASTFNRLASVDPVYMTYTVLTLERAATLAPTDPITNYNLGVALYRTGETSRAIETLEKLNQMKPDYVDSRFALAEIYILEGEKQKAKGELEYILKNIDPENESAKTFLEKLEKK